MKSGWLDALTEWVGRSVAWLTYGMVLGMVLIVILRYGFSISVTALNESVSYQFALLFMLGAAYTLKHDDHVRVDIFYRRFAPRTQAWINLLGSVLFLLPVMMLIIWMSSDYVQAAWAIREGSREGGGLPLVYALKTLLWVMPVLMILQGLAEMARAVGILRGDSITPPSRLRTEV